jgi:hypothetical protein
MNNKLINDDLIKNKLDIIFKDNFNHNYDHRWLEYIKINPNISNYEYCHIYFKNCFIKTILKSSLHEEKILTFLIDEIIEKIKINSIKLGIYHLPDILKINKNYELLYSIQSSVNELNSWANNNKIYIKNISKKLLMIDFSIKNNKITFYIKHSKFFECYINELDMYINNNEIINKYREIENKKTKICIKIEFHKYYDENFIKYMFQKGYWIDFHHLIGDDYNFSDIIFQDNILYFYYYDIIIYDSSSCNILYEIIKKWNLKNSYYNLNMIKNKMFIILNKSLNLDFGCKFDDINIKKLGVNKFIYFAYPNFLNNNSILHELCKLSHNFKDSYTNFNRLIDYKNNCDKISYFSNIDTLTYSFNNFNFLSKENFFRNYNLNLKKKLVTIYLTHPSSYSNFKNKKKESNYRNNFEFELLTKNINFLLNLSESFVKNNCNVVIKPHPRNNVHYYPYKNVILDNENMNDELKNHIRSTIEYLKILNKNLIFIDLSYSNELYKYSDYTVFLCATTTRWTNYLYNTPSLNISTKKEDLDWFKVDEHFLLKYVYGDLVYYEDIKDNIDDTIKNFLNKNHNYKYFSDHPLYNDLYYTNYKKLGNQIIDLINSNKNLRNTKDSIKLLIEYTYITVYDKNNINLELIYDEIIMSITGIPSNSYGFSIKVFKNNNINKLKLSFDCKLEKEENINLRIYTGNKWIQLENFIISSSYKTLSIYEEFNFNSMSRWRISTTSKTIGQKLFIKNLKFTI